MLYPCSLRSNLYFINQSPRLLSYRYTGNHFQVYKLCLPTSWLGSSAVVMTQPSVTPPARYNTLLISLPAPPPAYKCCAISGLTMPKSLPQKLAIPHAVPLIGAGKASGVHPYKTELNMDWKKYSMTLNPTLDAAEFTLLKRKIEMPINADETTIVHLRPTRDAR